MTANDLLMQFQADVLDVAGGAPGDHRDHLPGRRLRRRPRGRLLAGPGDAARALARGWPNGRLRCRTQARDAGYASGRRPSGLVLGGRIRGIGTSLAGVVPSAWSDQSGRGALTARGWFPITAAAGFPATGQGGPQECGSHTIDFDSSFKFWVTLNGEYDDLRRHHRNIRLQHTLWKQTDGSVLKIDAPAHGRRLTVRAENAIDFAVHDKSICRDGWRSGHEEHGNTQWNFQVHLRLAAAATLITSVDETSATHTLRRSWECHARFRLRVRAGNPMANGRFRARSKRCSRGEAALPARRPASKRRRLLGEAATHGRSGKPDRAPGAGADRGEPLPRPAPANQGPRIFGGLVIAQALLAAYATVEERLCHSLHCYFIRPGDPCVPILYEVDRARDGRSFTTRRVTAIQHGEQIFNLAASFQVDEQGLEHQDPMPDVPPPAEALSDDPRRARAGDGRSRCGRSTAGRSTTARPGPAVPERLDARRRRRSATTWSSTRRCSPTPPTCRFLSTSMRPHGMNWQTPGLQTASLDHAIWFHRPSQFNDWHLYAQKSPSASGSRGFNLGEIYNRTAAWSPPRPRRA